VKRTFTGKEGIMVYLIDDDRSVRRAFELFLKAAGIKYRSFESADEFLSGTVPELTDLLVLDLTLPGMSGCDLLKKFHQDDLQIPVIVVTAYDEPVSRECCRQYGVKAYLRKPVDGEALIDLIKFNLPVGIS
jgi:FixJ family two-component response regulator